MATDTPHEFCCIILNSANKKKYIYIYISLFKVCGSQTANFQH